MNAIDRPIISFLNQFAGRSSTFDQFVFLLANNYLLKSGVIIALLYWLWLRSDDRPADRRATMIFGLFASCAAILLARLLAACMPFRERPLRNPDLHFVIPTSMTSHNLIGWSAFPSDTATLWFGVATCLFLVSRRAGLFAFAYVAVVSGLARIYLGIHYPTDILAGALLGIGVVSLVRVPSLKAAVTHWPMRVLHDDPPLAHTAFCFMIFIIGTTFEPVYQLGIFALKAVKPALSAVEGDGYSTAALWLALFLLCASTAAAMLQRGRRTGPQQRP